MTSNRSIVIALPAALSLLSLAGMLKAQQISGSISGVVLDAQGAVVQAAKATLIHQTQGVTAMAVNTSQEGTFVFTPLVPGTYTVKVEADGFKKYSRIEMPLDANQRLELPPIVLEIGSASETVTVDGRAVALETISPARSGVVDQSQVNNLAMNGRSIGAVLRILPGVENDTNSVFGQAIVGQRNDQYTYTLDGVTMQDSGCGCFAFRYSVDAIDEISVATNALPAEFGHSAGPQITIVSKSGGRQFHGTGYWFHRDESFNANSYTNNLNGISRPIYRFMTAGWNLGGPFYIPHLLNRHRDKIFFFAQQEWNHSLAPAALQELTMPTALQRQGVFTDAKDSGGVLQIIKDPTTGNPFPNQTVPRDRWNKYGAAILNWLPQPNTVPTATYNWISQVPQRAPQFDEVYRADYDVSDKWRFTFRLTRNHSTVLNPYSALASSNLYGAATPSPTGAWGVMSRLSTIISPTLTNEFVYGNTRNYLPVDPPESNSPYLRANTPGMAIPLLYPKADPAGMVPNLAFGGVPSGTGLLASTIGNSSAYSQWYGLPAANENPTINYTDNLTKVVGTHTVKAGIFIETATKTQSPYADVGGSLIFDQDSQNPGDTGWAYANALLGNYRAFTQISNYEVAKYRYSQVEWYGQDTWKVRSNLTLNYGVRFSIMKPLDEENNLVSSFVPSAYDPGQAVVLYRPGCLSSGPCTGANRVAVNPLTGATLPGGFIGAIVPGVGNINNGMMQQGVNGEPSGLTKSRGPQVGPRFGLAWTPGGSAGKTVVRMGGGVFFERIQGNYLYYQITNPPVLRESQLWYGNIDNIANSQATNFPVYAGGVAGDGHLPTVYNYNFGVQRILPLNMLLDVAYVGSLSRHQTELVPFNDSAFGSAWLPQNQDPTKCPVIAACNLNGDNALPVSFYRPYIGYNGPAGSAQGALYEFGGTANYNSLHVALNRRLTGRLQFGVAYTWSKALGVQSSTTTNGALPATVDWRKGMYGPLDFDRTQMLTINYLFDLPEFASKSRWLNSVVGREILNGWQLSGITAFSSGAPISPTAGNSTSPIYSVSTGTGTISGAQLNRQVTGSEDVAPRYAFTCDPQSGGGSSQAFFNAACFAPAPKGSVGVDSGWNRLRGPGYNNWDISVFKKFHWAKEESRYLQLRLETFNAFNHTEWGGVNVNAVFNTVGQITNLPSALGGSGGRFGFGALTTVRSNSQRILQIAAKLYF